MTARNSWYGFLCVLLAFSGDVPAARGQCAGGVCTPRTAGGGSLAANGESPPPAVVRIVNATGAVRMIGSGTLVDKNDQHGLIVSCAHLFEQGVGQVTVFFPDGRSYGAKVLGADRSCDLSALLIVAPTADPVAVASALPPIGARVDSCGYGEDGRFWINHGKTLRFVSLNNAPGAETLELSGGARQGDSGGPVFNDRRELTAVLFGTNGRVVDGTCCLRIRTFLGRFSDSFKPNPAPQPPLVAIPNSPAAASGNPNPSLLDKIKQLEADLAKASADGTAKSGLLDNLRADLAANKTDLESKLAGANNVADTLRKQVADLNQRLGDALANANLPAPPAPADPVQQVVATGAAAALTALFGIPAGPAGWIATILLPLLGAGGLAGLRKLLPSQSSASNPAAVQSPATVTAQASPQAASQAAPQPATQTAPPATSPTVLHHNQYVPYQNNTADAAWAKAMSISPLRENPGNPA
jgi:hypothetical protein